MAYDFNTASWSDRIAQVSTRPEFQRAVIRIFDESAATLVTPYDIETGLGPVYEGGDIYEGQARVIGVR